jgi:hypothetical protein
MAASAFAPARADSFSIGFGSGGVAFSYDSGGYCDRWGCPDNYWDMPIYDCPVYWRGEWYRGPVYYRRMHGRLYYWLHGDWRMDEWRGMRPHGYCVERYREPLGFMWYENNGFRIRDDWRRRWHREHGDRDWNRRRPDDRWDRGPDNRRWDRGSDDRRQDRDGNRDRRGDRGDNQDRRWDNHDANRGSGPQGGNRDGFRPGGQIAPVAPSSGRPSGANPNGVNQAGPGGFRPGGSGGFTPPSGNQAAPGGFRPGAPARFTPPSGNQVSPPPSGAPATRDGGHGGFHSGGQPGPGGVNPPARGNNRGEEHRPTQKRD